MDIDAELKKIRKTLRNKYPDDVVMQLLQDFLKERVHPLVTKYLRADGNDEGKVKLKVSFIIDELVKLGFDKTESSCYGGVEYKGLCFLIKGDKNPYVELTDPLPGYYIHSNPAHLASFIREVGDNFPLWAAEFESIYSENRDKIEELEILSRSPKHSSEPISIEDMFKKRVEVLDVLYCQKVDQNAKADFIKSLDAAGYFYTVDRNGRVRVELNHIVVDYHYSSYSYGYVKIKNNPSLDIAVSLSGGTFTLLKKLDDLTPVWLEDIEGKHQTLLKQFKVNDFDSKAITLLVKTKMKACGYDYHIEKVGDVVKLMIKAKAKRFVSCSFKSSDMQNIEKQLNEMCHCVEVINQMKAWVKIGVYGKDISWEKNGGTDYN